MIANNDNSIGPGFLNVGSYNLCMRDFLGDHAYFWDDDHFINHAPYIATDGIVEKCHSDNPGHP